MSQCYKGGGLVRVWDVHPGYLSRQSLLGQHVEIHGIYSIITQGKKGYACHPETMRWREQLGRLRQRHALTVSEMCHRGFRHKSPLHEVAGDECGDGEMLFLDRPSQQLLLLDEKYRVNEQRGRLPLPRRASEFWAHHKYAVMARGYQYYRQVQTHLHHEGDLPIGEAHGLVDMVTGMVQEPPSRKGLGNAIAHLWGYFKNTASREEKDAFFSLDDSDLSAKLEFVRCLTAEYAQPYLLYATVFVDLPVREHHPQGCVTEAR